MEKTSLIVGLVPVAIALIAGVYAYGELAGRVASLEREYDNVTEEMKKDAKGILDGMNDLADRNREQLDRVFAGAIVMTAEPCDQLGTQWKPYKAMEGRVPLAAGETEEQLERRKVFESGQIGGVYVHRLQDHELPAHRHSYLDRYFHSRESGRHPGDIDDHQRHYYEDRRETEPSPGKGEAHENMPPYLVVNFCQKT